MADCVCDPPLKAAAGRLREGAGRRRASPQNRRASAGAGAGVLRVLRRRTPDAAGVVLHGVLASARAYVERNLGAAERGAALVERMLER